MSKKHTDVNTLGEFGLIEHLTDTFKTHQQSSTFLGVGDDAALIERDDKHYTVISTDMMVEGIHFDLMYSPLKHLGYKAVVTNLSDIYAMNAKPEQITVSIAISSKYSVEALSELYTGIKTACEFYGVDLIGGDTTSSPKGMALSVTAIGVVEKGKESLRSGAKMDDIVCVTGDLGAAYLGLQLLEREKQLYLSQPETQPDLEEATYLIERQLKPEANKAAYEYFEKTKLVPTSMIDVSDGLASELFHIAKSSKVGIIIEESKVPLHPDTQEMALKFNIDPITCALNGGEDYELLFTVNPKDLEKVRYMPDVFIIGDIVEEANGVKLFSTGGKLHPMKAQGWNHFEAEK